MGKRTTMDKIIQNPLKIYSIMITKTITDSFQLLGNGKIIELTFNLSERQWIQSVRYEISSFDTLPYIVTVSGRQKLFLLQDNPDVIKFENGIYYIHSLQRDQKTAEDIEVDVTYQIDKNSGNVFRVPHLYIKFENGSGQIFYNETIETYNNILITIQKKHPELAEGLLVKIDGTYKYFLDLDL